MAKGFRRRLKAYRLLRQPQAAVVLGGASKKQPWTVEETETSLYRSRRQRARRSPTSISRRSRDARAAAELITGDEARRIAATIAKLLTPLKRRHVAKATLAAGMIEFSGA